MLVEVQCDKFIEKGKKREAIQFHPGLNVVLGDDNGSNSIGKSTFLMILDFVFGGSDYIKKCTDVQENVREHTINFCYCFNNELYYFSRNTTEYKQIFRCDKYYRRLPNMKPMTLAEYGEFLCEKYGLLIDGLTWRSAVARFIFRGWLRFLYHPVWLASRNHILQAPDYILHACGRLPLPCRRYNGRRR